MAENEEGQEKTEQPTDKRTTQARSEGQVFRSQEVNLVAGLMAALVYFALSGAAMVESLKNLLQGLLTDFLCLEITQVSVSHLLQDTVVSMLVILLPFMLVLLVVGVGASIFQSGLNWSTKPMQPKFTKVLSKVFNPVAGLKVVFNAGKLIELLKSVIKLLVISVVPYKIIKNEMYALPLIMDMSIWHIMNYIGVIILKILLYVGIILLFLALADFIYQKWKYKKDLMMTKEEVKDEHKQSEGDPIVKSAIRRKQMEFLRKLMMENVPKADVVITNPVHLAVALHYDRASMDAPKVVAKGARLMAERIKKIARENNVPIIENKPLAQSLYKTVEVGDSIPEALYKAVAEVLAYVYSRKQKVHAA
ncbi:MAG: flagellar biosynthesis protein FlhB [Pseudomonadota bacterium]